MHPVHSRTELVSMQVSRSDGARLKNGGGAKKKVDGQKLYVVRTSESSVKGPVLGQYQVAMYSWGCQVQSSGCFEC